MFELPPLEWPFAIGLDNSFTWRNKPYEQRMELIGFYCQEFHYVL